MDTKVTNTNKKGFLSKISDKNKVYAVKLWGRMITAMVCVMALFGTGITAFAATNDSTSFDNVVSFIVTWVQRIGYVIGFIGAVQFGFALKQDDADGKQRGLMALASGFVVVAICIAYSELFASAV
jgi:hypothetical protein